jgi:hypothetical protein
VNRFECKTRRKSRRAQERSIFEQLTATERKLARSIALEQAIAIIG